MIQRADNMKRIIFVCTGNTCRSPMAKVLFEKHLNDKKVQNVEVDSCGIFATKGSPAAKNAVIIAKKLGADLKDHKSKPLNNEIIQGTSLFVCMSEKHSLMLQRLVAQDKTIVLGDGIPDPYGQNEGEYMKCAQKIIEGFEQIASMLDKK